MSIKTRHLTLSSGSHVVALPRISHNVPKVSPAQAIISIRQLGRYLMLNRCQLKRLGAVCQSVYQNSVCKAEMDKLLARVHARCRIWRYAGPLESLVLVPSEIDEFETELSRLGTPRESFFPHPEDERSEKAAITSALEQILLNEQARSRAMTLRGHPAELFVSHLQIALDVSPNLNPKAREEWITALLHLSVEASVLPSVLRIEEVALIGSDPVARGGFSDVYQGKWKDKLVAVKRPRGPRCDSQDSSEISKQLQREILLWRQLSHEYVLPLLGVFKEERPLYDMVSEWMPNGTLKAFLENPRYQGRNRLQLVYQVALALEYLHTHSPPIAHGDIKASNIFIDGSFRPLFGDFGLSSIRYTNDRTMSSTLIGGTMRWMAPELLRPDSNSGGYGIPSLASDKWAFAMLALEVFTGEMPYAKEKIDTVVFYLITNEQKLPERPGSHITERGLTDDVWELLMSCWNFTHPENRPSATHLRQQLEILSKSTQITAENEREKIMFIPKALVKHIISSDTASWKTLGVRIVEESGTIKREGVPTTVVQIIGRAAPVAEACLRIEESIRKYADVRMIGFIDIPREFYSRLIGSKHCNHRKLENEYGVEINFPSRQSRSSQVTIAGSAEAIEKTRDKLRKMLWFERNSRDVLEVSSRVAERVEEQRKRIVRPPLWDLKVEYHGSNATITLRGKREGIVIAQKSIRAIEEEVEREITEEIPLDAFHHDMITSDRQAWVDIIERCEGPPCPDSDKYPYVLAILPNSIRVRGPPNLIKTLRTEVEELTNIGHSYVSAKEISTHRHQSLLQGGLVSDLRNHARAMVYFPKSGGYKYLGKPQDMDHYGDNVDFKKIVKVVGTPEECQKARAYLKARVEEQRKREQNPVYMFPAILHDAVKRRLDPMFGTLGVTVESKVPTSEGSLLCLVSEDKELITLSAPGWSIHIRDTPKDIPMCKMRPISQTEEDSKKAGQALEKEARTLCRRIGVLELPTRSHVQIMKEKIEILEGQSDDLLCEVVEQSTPCRLVVGGPSTDTVESVILGATALIEAAD